MTQAAMPPKKRDAPLHTPPSDKKAKRTRTPAELQGPRRATPKDEARPWIHVCLEECKNIFGGKVALNAWLDTAIVAAGGLEEWARKLDECFPPEEGVEYLRADTISSGNVHLRLWQLGSHPDTGTSGLLMHEVRVPIALLSWCASVVTQTVALLNSHAGAFEKSAFNLPLATDARSLSA